MSRIVHETDVDLDRAALFYLQRAENLKIDMAFYKEKQ